MAKAATRLFKQSAEISWLAPYVVAQRVGGMMLSSFNPSARGRKEVQRMGVEKAAAFSEAWSSMAVQAMFMPWTLLSPAQSRDAALKILSNGIAPVHRTVKANARRLSR